MTRRAKLQAVFDNAVNNGLTVADLAARLRDFTKGGGSGIDSAVNALFEATQPVTTSDCEDKVASAKAKIQEILDSLG